MTIKKKKKKNDQYLLRIFGSKVGIFWEFWGDFLRIFLRIFLRMKVFPAFRRPLPTTITIETPLKYDQEAFTKAWDYLAKSPSDDKDD